MDTVIVRGEGCYMVDADGNRILDLAAGQFCSILGYSHPAFVERSIVDTKRGPTVATTPARPPAPVIQSPVPETAIAHERPSSPSAGQQPFFQ